MSTPLTDSINALTAYANETTGASDTTLSDAVHTLASGYGQGGSVDALLNVINFRCEENLLPSTITIDITNLLYLGLPKDWAINSGLEHLIIKGDKLIETKNTVSASANSSICYLQAFQNVGIKDITFENGMRISGQMMSFFQFYVDLEAIYGELDFTNVTAWTYNYPFFGCQKLRYLRLKRNSALTIANMNLNALVALDDDSLISVGNGLGMVTDTHTISFANTQKARCSTLMGNNVDGLFVADENGTMSLADFITTVKGWTLA